MNINEVSSFLENIQPALVAAVTHDIEKHVARLAETGREFYGYALLPGELYDVNGLDAAKKAGVFGDTEKFMVVWISDSDVPIMLESAKRLNSATVVTEFAVEFG